VNVSAFVLSLLATQAGNHISFPDAIATPVYDPGALLADAIVEPLSRQLDAHASRTGAPVALVVLPEQDPAGLAAAMDVALLRLSIGYFARRPGVLIVFAPSERRLRIAVGTGLENQLTNDEIARYTEAAAVSFRAGETNAGLQSLIDSICAEVVSAPRRVRWFPVVAGGALAGVLTAGLGAFLKRRKVTGQSS
jgi:uncharacterized protein